MVSIAISIFLAVLLLLSIGVTRLIGFLIGWVLPRPTTPILVTIKHSHYCEKARWGLDLANFDYKEESK
jgi:hypothetical protein